MKRIVLTLASALLGAALLFGCGGGGVGTGGTGSYAQGSITGFGSIFVSGVEYDDSAATVLDDDGGHMARTGDELRLGMTVEIDAGDVIGTGNGRHARADTIRLAGLVVGPVEAVDTAASTVTVLGQTLQVDGATAFGTPLAGGLAALHAGDVIQAWALPAGASGSARATRLESLPTSSPYALRGIVRELDTAAKTLRIGNATLDYSQATGVPANLANGLLVRVKLGSTATNGVWPVLAFVALPGLPGQRDGAEVEGLVTAFTSSGSFSVDGVPVDASGATFDPSPSAVAAGVEVQVEGLLSNGVLIAAHVKVSTRGQGHGGDYTLQGSITSVDAAAHTFVLRHTVVDYGTAQFEGGTAAQLAAGVNVRVEGSLSSDRTRIVATEVTFR